MLNNRRVVLVMGILLFCRYGGVLFCRSNTIESCLVPEEGHYVKFNIIYSSYVVEMYIAILFYILINISQIFMCDYSSNMRQATCLKDEVLTFQ